MPKFERIREELAVPLLPEHIQERERAGWRLVAVEWEREGSGSEPAAALREEVPYGLRVSTDCLHLEEHPAERRVLEAVMELIVQDRPFSQIADELNERGLRMRNGSSWSRVAVFNLLPRLIEAGPRIFSSSEWAARRPHLLRVV